MSRSLVSRTPNRIRRASELKISESGKLPVRLQLEQLLTRILTALNMAQREPHIGQEQIECKQVGEMKTMVSSRTRDDESPKFPTSLALVDYEGEKDTLQKLTSSPDHQGRSLIGFGLPSCVSERLKSGTSGKLLT
jgi:hypothetical protein